MKLKDRYGRLIGWIDYVRGERNNVPGIGLRVPLNRAGISQTLVSLARWMNDRKPDEPIFFDSALPLPSTADRLFIGWNKAVGLKIEILRGETGPEELLAALQDGGPHEPALLRLRLCPVCELPFVALNLLKQRCTRCANRARQRKHYELKIAGKGKRTEAAPAMPESHRERYNATRRLSRKRKRARGAMVSEVPRSKAEVLKLPGSPKKRR